MSESVQHQPFHESDTPLSAFENNEVAYIHPLLSLADHVRYVHPMFEGRIESETRHAERRYAMLQLAVSYYDHEQYAAAISELKEVRHDFEISGDDTHFTALDAAIEHCRERSSSKTTSVMVSRSLNQIA